MNISSLSITSPISRMYTTNDHILSYPDNISSTKYHIIRAEGKNWEYKDFLLPVYHKKHIKQLHRKNLGSKMMIYYLPNRQPLTVFQPIDDGILSALSLFQYFDEDTGNISYFLYKISKEKTDHLVHLFMDLNLDHLWTTPCYSTNQQTTTFTTDQTQPIPTKNTSNIVSFLFALSLIYGKYDIKHNILHTVTIPLPLFGQFLSHEDHITILQHTLAQQGLFIKINKTQNNNTTILQITINDREILDCFVKMYKTLENTNGISTYDRIQYHKTLLDIDPDDIQYALLKSLVIE